MNANESPKSTNRKEIQRLAFKILIGLPAAGFIWTFLFWWIGSDEIWNWNIMLIFSGFGVVLGGGSLISQIFGIWLERVWCYLILIIDQAFVWSCLPLFYYLIFSPYSLLLQIFGKSKFNRKMNKSSTYWNKVDQPLSKQRYLQQF